MRFKPTSAVAFACVACAMIVTSCATDVETDVNVDPAGNAISFAPSVGHSTRATETTISNLGNFAVVARGMHPNGVLYDSYLIGAKDGGEIAKFNSLASDNSGIWQLDRKIYWPASMKRALFIGYTTLKRGSDNVSEGSADDVLGSAKFGVDETDHPNISNFSPLKKDLSETPEVISKNRIWADGENQKDLVVAFEQKDWSIQSTVPLNFRHALTQVSINAIQKDKDVATDNRIVKVKGAWIVNAAKTGTLTATIKTNSDMSASNETSWTTTDDKETYGTYYDDIIPLQNNATQDLLAESLMLIPENLNQWDGTEDGTGAYIMLLCRIELKHEGGTGHEGADLSDTGISGDYHYHQLFPVNTEKYDGSQYGFICVPISTDWGEEVADQDDCKGAGKHYTYTLDICGAKSGAGLYPPAEKNFKSKLIPADAKVKALVLIDGKYVEQTVDLEVVETPPTDKGVGDKVLDDPIQFSVTVKGWENETGNWTDGTGKF